MTASNKTVDYEQQMNIQDIPIGTARDDGKILAQRRKNNQGWWVTPEKFELIKEANRERHRKYREKNKEASIERCRQWRKENIEHCRKTNLERYHKNKNRYQQSSNQWKRNNRDKINKYRRDRRKNNLQCRIDENLRSGFKQALKAQMSCNFTSNASFNLLGCSFTKLKEHIESMFKEGMSWSNYGEWHIDHIKPLCMHDLSIPEEQALACHYKNLQPLWGIENMSKGGRRVG